MNVTSTGIAVALAVIVVLGFFLFGIVNPFAQPAPVAMEDSELVAGAALPITNNGELMITDTQTGTGAEAVNGTMVSVHYTGMLEDGSVFDSSIPRGEPITFQLGAGMVIQGWEQGILGMKVGGKRHLVIPSDLAYGPQGRPPVIPANATLIFDVELVGVQ